MIYMFQENSWKNKILLEISLVDQIWSITSGKRSISIADGRNLPHEVDKVRAVHGGHLETQGFHHLAPVGQIKEMNIETINEVPKAIRAVEQRHDVLYKLQAHLPGKEVDKLNH